jgi:DNA (cytosine-5)-methyltransferase 1
LNGLALSSAACSDADGGRCLHGLSLCAGAGGLDLGLHLAVSRYRTVGYVEREAYAAATLVARMEDAALDRAPIWDDVATFDGRPWRGLVDIVHGGYPCQPFSVAGRKLGDKDPRHLWPYIARIVGEVQPALCFFENVGGHLRLGFEQVHDDLRQMGFRVKAGLFTAEEVGASHKRERLFILAYAEGARERGKAGDILEAHGRQDGALLQLPHGADLSMADAARAGAEQQRPHAWQRPERDSDAALGDPDGAGLEGRRPNRQQSPDPEQSFPPGPANRAGWERYLQERPYLEPAVRGGADGLACRVDRLRLGGNGVVPLAAAYAFRTLAAAANIEI